MKVRREFGTLAIKTSRTKYRLILDWDWKYWELVLWWRPMFPEFPKVDQYSSNEVRYVALGPLEVRRIRERKK